MVKGRAGEANSPALAVDPTCQAMINERLKLGSQYFPANVALWV